jgi:hypothetical protein
MAKSNKIYAVAVTDKAEFRDDLLADIFDLEKSKKLSYLSNSYGLNRSEYIGSAKIWKTKHGAKRSLDLKIKQAEKRANNGYYWGGIKAENFRFDIIEVDKDKWNSYIDLEIQKIKNTMSKKINSWESKRIK